MTETILNINGIKKKSSELSLDDLIILYREYEDKYGKLPTTRDAKSKYNLPQQRVINRVLKENNVTYKEFMNNLGKVKHVRTESDDYDLFLNKYKKECEKLGRALLSSELINNNLGLPSVKWFIKNCPDKTVKTYDDFVRMCGYQSNKKIMDKEDVSLALIEYEKTLGRPITGRDITLEKVGFSQVVIKRLWGSLNECKRDLNLKKSKSGKPLPFLHYKNALDFILSSIKNDKNRDYITWNDIENPKYNPNKIEHKTFTAAFKREGLDIFAYIKSKGFMMNPSNFSFHYTFDDGERVVSSMEYDFSYFLKEELEYRYNIDYERDVMYKLFLPYRKNSKMNCDYVLYINGEFYYIEIAGIIHNINNDWKNIEYSTKQEQGYKDKLIHKQELLEKNCKKYLFLFPEDFTNEQYKQKIKDLITGSIGEVA